MKLGDQIRKRRRALIPAESIKELALEAGVSELTVGDIERGTTTNPGVETVEAINNALNRLKLLQIALECGAYGKDLHDE